MKKILILTIATCTLLNFTHAAQASPKDVQRRAAQIAAMCQDKETRAMMLHELTNTKERKLEAAKLLNEDSEFRSVQMRELVNPG